MSLQLANIVVLLVGVDDRTVQGAVTWATLRRGAQQLNIFRRSLSRYQVVGEQLAGMHCIVRVEELFGL